MTHVVNIFELHAGDSRTLEVTVTDEDSNVVVDITDCDVFWVVSRVLGSASLLTKQVGTGITVVDAPAGRFDIQLDSDDTQELQGSYYHESRMIDDTGAISTILSGSLTITQTQLLADDLA